MLTAVTVEGAEGAAAAVGGGAVTPSVAVSSVSDMVVIAKKRLWSW